jgi:hypothetical protein
MAKKRQVSDAGMEGVEGALTRTEQFIEDNQKWIVRILAEFCDSSLSSSPRITKS